MLDAAKLAGLNPLTLMNAGTAAAINFVTKGILRDDCVLIQRNCVLFRRQIGRQAQVHYGVRYGRVGHVCVRV